VAQVKLADFKPLKPAEAKLVDWLQDGQRGVCIISGSVPPDPPPPEHILRATFLRYLALGGCDGCRLPSTGVRVQGAYILGDDTRGEETQGLDLEGATLPGDLALFACRVPDPILLRSARIKSLFLNGSVLGNGLKADRLQADGNVHLHEATIKGEMRLLGARIGGNLGCAGASLEAEGNVLSCDRLQADGSVFLGGATIKGAVRFPGARIGGDLYCTKASLEAEGTALLASGAVIVGVFFLRDGASVKGAIDLTAASLGAINDDEACWPSEIILDRCRYGAFTGGPVDADSRIRWLALQKPQKYGEEFWPDSYEHCAKVLREAGHGNEARAILIEKEKLHRKARRDRLAANLAKARDDRNTSELRDGVRPYSDRVIGFWLRLNSLWLWDSILAVFVGYGRKPQNAAIWAVGFILLGWIIFLRAEGFAQIKPNLPQIQRADEWVECGDGGRLRAGYTSQLVCFLDQPEGRSYPQFSAFIYSIDTFAPVVSLEMQSYWIPDDSQPIGYWARVYLWIHIAMGWALTLLAVAGFSGLIKTDGGK